MIPKKSCPSKKNRRQPDARSAAINIVQAVRLGQIAVQAALDAEFNKLCLPSSERPFATELVYGSLRNYIRLEWFLRRFLPRFDSLPTEMKTALCVALYELFFTKVPVYATVNTYVGMIRNRFGLTLGKVTNGVLRNADRNRSDFSDLLFYERNCTTSMEALAYWYALPQWLVELWVESYGDAAARGYMESSAQAAPSALRFNSNAAGARDAFWELLPYSQQASALSLVAYDGGEKEGAFDATSCDVSDVYARLYDSASMLSFSGPLPERVQAMVEQGVVSQQSAAAQEILAAMQPGDWQGPVWDCCCGRGGKTLALLEQGIEIVFASDVSKSRLQGLRKELERTGLAGKCFVEHFSATADLATSEYWLSEKRELFGTILVDAPCSGFGTLARHPEIRFRRTLDDVERLAGLQREILRNTARFLAPGGSIVYITCTLTPQENEQQIALFVKENPCFTVRDIFITPYDSLYGEFFYGARLVLV